MPAADEAPRSQAALRPVDDGAFLRGAVVVELGDSVAVSTCGWVLARLGAEVRFAAHARALDIVADADVAAATTAFLEQDKKAVERDAGAVAAALREADVVVVEADAEPVGGLDLLALARDGARLKPGAVVIEVVTPTGEEGSAGNDLTVAAETAMSWVIGEAGLAPLTLPFAIASTITGVSAASAAITGILSQGGPRPVERIEVSARRTIAYLVGMRIPNFLPYGRPWAREGSRPPGSAGVYPCGLFPCKDGMVALYVRSNAEWRALVAAMGDPEWSRLPHLQDAIEIAEHHADEADSYLIPWLMERSRNELNALGAEHDIPLAAVRSLDDVLADGQFAHRGTFRPFPVPGGREVVLPTMPWRAWQPAGAVDGTGARRSWPERPDAGTRAPGPLAGLRVLDFSWVWSGPMVGQMLVDLGADVIKVESSKRLESLRSRGRPKVDGKPLDGPISELGPWFNQLNHDKRSIDLDIKSAEGQAIVRELVASCDVVIENMRPGAMDRAGLGYETLASINPAITMLSMSMCGQTGPLSTMKGYAGIMTAMAGLDGLVGYPADEATGEPANVIGMAASALGDPNGALFSLPPLLAALKRARETGVGAWIDLAQVDAVVSLLTAPLIEHQLHGTVVVRGNSHPAKSPYGHYRAEGDDAWVAIEVADDTQWRSLVALAGTPGLAALAGLAAPDRVARRHDVDEAVTEWTRTRRPDGVVRELARAGITSTEVSSYERMLDSSWYAGERLTNRVHHPYLGDRDIYLLPWRIDGEAVACERPGPLLGADTAAVTEWFRTTQPVQA